MKYVITILVTAAIVGATTYGLLKSDLVNQETKSDERTNTLEMQISELQKQIESLQEEKASLQEKLMTKDKDDEEVKEIDEDVEDENNPVKEK